MSDTANIVEKPKLFNYEIYERVDGWFSFRINDQESCYRSSNTDGLKRTIKTLQHGNDGTTNIQIPSLEGKGGETVSQELIRTLVLEGAEAMKLSKTQLKEVEKTLGIISTKNVGPRWQDMPTEEERVEAFLKRGKLETTI